MGVGETGVLSCIGSETAAEGPCFPSVMLVMPSVGSSSGIGGRLSEVSMGYVSWLVMLLIGYQGSVPAMGSLAGGVEMWMLGTEAGV